MSLQLHHPPSLRLLDKSSINLGSPGKLERYIHSTPHPLFVEKDDFALLLRLVQNAVYKGGLAVVPRGLRVHSAGGKEVLED